MKVRDYFLVHLLLVIKRVQEKPGVVAIFNGLCKICRVSHPLVSSLIRCCFPPPRLLLNEFCNSNIFLSRVLYIIFIKTLLSTLLHPPGLLFQYNCIKVAPPAVYTKSCAAKSRRSISSRKSGYTTEMFHLDIVFLKIHRTRTLKFTHTHTH